MTYKSPASISPPPSPHCHLLATCCHCPKQMNLHLNNEQIPSSHVQTHCPRALRVVDKTCLPPLGCFVRVNPFKNSIFRNSPCPPPPASLSGHSLPPKPHLCMQYNHSPVLNTSVHGSGAPSVFWGPSSWEGLQQPSW